MRISRYFLEVLTFALLFTIILFGIAAFAQAPELPAADPFKLPDLEKVYQLLNALGFLIMTILGAVTVLATIAGKLAKLVTDWTESKEDDERAQMLILFANKLSAFTLQFLHIFPTLGKNPSTKALEEKLNELKADQNV